jgi:hypothetical protein
MSLKAKPPKPVPVEDRISAFVNNATASSSEPVQATSSASKAAAAGAPWKAPHVRQDVTVQLNVRIPEPMALKLKHVTSMTDQQRQDIVARALGAVLDEELLKLGFSESDL